MLTSVKDRFVQLIDNITLLVIDEELLLSKFNLRCCFFWSMLVDGTIARLGNLQFDTKRAVVLAQEVDG